MVAHCCWALDDTRTSYLLLCKVRKAAGGRGERHGRARWLAAGVVLRLRRWMMSSLAWRAAVDRSKFNM
jgi:hypothetical protein